MPGALLIPRLDPKLDIVFKLLVTREPALLRNMLEGVLAKPIRELTIIDPGIPGELSTDKTIVLDIRAVLDDGSRVDVEMQIRSTPSLRSRLVYYGARDYADQLGRGDGYHLLTPTVVVVWLVEPLFPLLDRLHSVFELRERDTHIPFGDQLAIHVLQLGALSACSATDYNGIVGRWARFLMGDDAELDRLAAEDPIMALAKDTLDQLSQDPETHRLARERADAIKLYEMDLAAARADATAAGKAELLLKQLAVRFGPLSEATRARVEAATSDQLDTWAERVLTAAALDEVLRS